MNYCSNCGFEISVGLPDGEERERYHCTNCGVIHYQNPKMVVGCIPERGDRILLCRRSIEPRAGYWTIPAGFMELSETVAQGAAREAWEEARTRVEMEELYSVFTLTPWDQVYLIYRARLLDDDFRAGEESLECRLFAEEEVPWDELAFTVIAETLRLYFADRRRNAYRLHVGVIDRG